MANVIRTMKDVDGNTVFPRTYAQAVTMGDGSINLEEEIAKKAYKPSLLPEKTTLADTDLVTIEGTGGVVNKMTVGNFRKLIEPDWKLIASSGVSIGGSKTLTAPEKIKEVMVVGAVYNSVVFTKAVQSLDPTNSVTKKIQDGNNTQNFIVSVQIIGDSSIYVAPLATSDQGVSAVFYR